METPEKDQKLPLKIAVFGHHPDLFPGFNALMAVNFCYGFAREGHHVTLLLPDTKEHPQSDRIKSIQTSTDKLDRFGVDFEIRVIRVGEDLGRFDFGVWQSYFRMDEQFWPAFRSAVLVTYKNFPRLLAGLPEMDEKSLLGAASRFDLVGLALKIDVDIALAQFGDRHPTIVERCIYTPRGFRSDWFSDSPFGEVPTIGIEKGVASDGSEYGYMVGVVEELRRDFEEINVIGARINDKNIITKTLPLLPATEFYKQFLNPLWAYAMIDVNKSRQGMNERKVNCRPVYLGMYENQIVEAQMAGAAVIGHEDAMPLELVGTRNTGLRFSKFEDSEIIIEFLKRSFENRASVFAEARKWAMQNHSISNMVNPLLGIIAEKEIKNPKERWSPN